MEQRQRYYKSLGGRYRPVTAAKWFWIVIAVVATLFFFGLGVGVIGAWITEPQWILDKWPYPTPKP